MIERIREKLNTLPEGFTIRPATMDDTSEITAMFNLVSRAMVGEDEFDENGLSAPWKSHRFDFEKDSRVVLNPEGKIVARQDCFAFADISSSEVRSVSNSSSAKLRCSSAKSTTQRESSPSRPALPAC